MAQNIIVFIPGQFFSVANDLIDVHAKTIGAAGVMVYMALARHMNHKSGTCHPSIGTLERVLGLARATIKAALRKLVSAGLITITERRDAAGDPTSHLYTLLDP